MPFPGGLYEQPYGTILRMEAVLDAHAKVSEVEYRKQRAREEAERKAQAGNGAQ